MAFFPVVGLAVGAVQAAAYGLTAWLLGPGPGALAALAAGFLVTRGLHWDGWLDCCDALLGAHTRQRRLAILRDSHVGAFAVVGGTWMALAQWLAVAQAPRPAAALMAAAIAGRWAMAVSMAVFPAARPEELGAWVRAGFARWHAAVATALALAAAATLGGLPAAGFMVGAGAAGLAFAAWANRLLGGLTGDVYGAVGVVTETAVLWLQLAAGGGASAGGAAR